MLRRFRQSRAGGVVLIFALVLPILLGVVALVAEYGNLLVVQAQYQRVADLSSYAGALAFSATNSSASMSDAAINMARLNGIAGGGISVSLVASPRSPSRQAVQATISGANPLFLAPILGAATSVQVASVAYTEIGAQTASCLLALDAGLGGIVLSGGAAVVAPTCTAASDAAIAVPCGTTLQAKAVAYNSQAAPSQPCNGISAGVILKGATADPLSGNGGVAVAMAEIAVAAAMSAPPAPVTPAGTSIDFAYNQASTIAQARSAGCTASFGGATWTLTCPSGGRYNFGNITLGGGINVNFNTAGSISTTYNFSGSIANAGAMLTFGNGVYNVANGITTSGGSTTAFGMGSFNLGRSLAACNGGGNYSICNSGTLNFGGPSTFQIAAGIQNAGGSTITLGYASGVTSNSFWIGPSSNGDSLTVGSGSKTYLGDATGSASVFRLVGDLNDAGGGGCLVVSAAAQHDIEGNFDASGAIILGAGLYAIDGYMALGAAHGGGGNCNGNTVSVSAQGVSIAVSGKAVPASGICAGQAFCVASGYSNIVLTAPTTGSTANLAIVGPAAAANTAGAIFSQGGSGGQITGALYFPNGPIAMSGGAGLSSTGCLQVIGSTVALSGGTTFASACITGGAAGGNVALVQ